jgi:hypothetical protein
MSIPSHSHTITGAQAKALDRALANVPRVLASIGATRERKPIASVTIDSVEAGVRLRGSDGSEGLIPRPRIDLPADAMLALLGLDSAPFAQGADQGGRLADLVRERDAIRAELDTLRQSHASLSETLNKRTAEVDALRARPSGATTDTLRMARERDAAREAEALAVRRADAAIADMSRRLADAEAEAKALARTVAKLRARAAAQDDGNAEETRLANAEAAEAQGAVAVDRGPVVVRFPRNGQGKGLRAAKLDLDALRRAGFRFTYDDRQNPAQGGSWAAPDSPQARRILDTLRQAGALA